MKAAVVFVVLGAVACVLASGCGKSGRSRRRGGDAGPSVVVVDRGQGGAAVYAEKEPNDETPQALVVPGGVKGAIDKAGDVDLYTVTVGAPGTLAITLSGVADADLMLELEGGAGEKLAASDNGPAGTIEGVPNWVAQPGTYKLRVREFVKKAPKKKAKKGDPDAGPTGRVAASQPYTLEVTLGPPPAADEEAEPNDQAAFAGEVALPGSARGYCGWRKDRDVWKVALAGIGDDEALSVDVDGVAGVALRVAVLDGTEAVLLERQGRTGEAVQLRNVGVREGEPSYYVAVSCAKGNPAEKYELRVSSAALELDEETEPNDSVAAAGPLADIPGAGGMRTGYLSHGDVDLYALDPAAEQRALHVTIEPPAGLDVQIAVVDELGAVVAGPADAAGKGKPETLQNVPVPAGARRYVKISAKPGAESGERYRLRWSAAAAAELAPPPLDMEE